MWNWKNAVVVLLLIASISQGEESRSATVPEATSDKLGPGDHVRWVMIDQRKRLARIHIPAGYSPEKPTPLVLAIHGAAMTGEMMMSFTGLNETSDQKGFVVVYPDGTGIGPLLTWNAGGFVDGVGTRVDDISFLRKLMDDVATVVNVDPKRVYATGMSNGGMMCYRLAAEMSDRFAAIAPVGGTMALAEVKPSRPVSVIHFHGTKDTLVPFEIGAGKPAPLLRLKSVEETVRIWAKLGGIETPPTAPVAISKEGDRVKVTRQTFGPGTDGAEVVLIVIEGGGHTWPGQEPPVEFLGQSTSSVSANELLWSFFEKHPRK